MWANTETFVVMLSSFHPLLKVAPNLIFPTISINSDSNNMKKKKKKQMRLSTCAASLSDNESDKFLREDTGTSTASTGNSDEIVMTGTTARARRLLKIREEKRKREHDRLHSYPPWAK